LTTRHREVAAMDRVPTTRKSFISPEEDWWVESSGRTHKNRTTEPETKKMHSCLSMNLEKATRADARAQVNGATKRNLKERGGNETLKY
jgi:hypothetical protein